MEERKAKRDASQAHWALAAQQVVAGEFVENYSIEQLIDEIDNKS